MITEPRRPGQHDGIDGATWLALSALAYLALQVAAAIFAGRF
jgi:hypothetical protein